MFLYGKSASRITYLRVYDLLHARQIPRNKKSDLSINHLDMSRPSLNTCMCTWKISVITVMSGKNVQIRIRAHNFGVLSRPSNV